MDAWNSTWTAVSDYLGHAARATTRTIAPATHQLGAAAHVTKTYYVDPTMERVSAASTRMAVKVQDPAARPYVIAGAAAAGAAAAGVVAAPLVAGATVPAMANALGFGTSGIAAHSTAAGMMSTLGGAATQAGSVVATLQSIGATGTLPAAPAVIAGSSVVGAIAGALTGALMGAITGAKGTSTKNKQ
ncbi:hypothetical protein GGF31_002766 [Allomyces arbusculus]|nr:hypothetical protein GGF31_002766 [Allomyces arbusculus]